ncbi:MAG: class I SAM-dependent methyltransferase [Rhodospirillaceae bacterium]|jgi:SAM-dependent methyltransferase|nr:class I SAM-dependent methyltransferase [Rhodospirillaceae bacterium]MBT5244007.1 class I SAM-dependent methyltransferase [Rhodospirillaceae bacterium]MBT5560827.1 class I SAM-dependent methyltransferase [Rhodospirillaceae bacterium]MBT6240565.1 class I SAM-dependent methyltransferase [Rhodospirillaceae bacterium]MBT7138365.1 class I SAM-dependent methyltransferase [Rhodospirillaceae bacterium]
MANNSDPSGPPRHLRITDPSPWVVRFAPLIKVGGTALDLACGGGRHTRHLLGLGHKVVALDRSTEALEDLAGNPDCQIINADLEQDAPVFQKPGELAGRTFDGVIVVNYLYRPLLASLLEALAPGGVLIYETFARGNERFTRPRNPDHLLKSGELLALTEGALQVVAYEHGIVEKGPLPGVIQRLCAVKACGPSHRDDAEPEPLRVHPETAD